jgi:hypothetical protein
MEMRTKIKAHYPHQTINDHNTDIYIADYTNQTKGERSVEITVDKPTDIKSFFIKNEKSIPFSSVIFDNRSFVDAAGQPLSQCECVCFSGATYEEGPWTLFLELKYSSRKSTYQKANLEKAKEQLIATYNYYREKGIINNKQNCYLIVSFPFYKPPFPNFAITPAEVKRMKLHKIVFRGANELKIKSKYLLVV